MPPFVGAAASALCLAASPAMACVPYQYVNAVAQARVKTVSGQWAPINIETDRSLIRVEYPSSNSPTGRFAIAGDIDQGWAYRFPVSANAEQHLPKRMPMQLLFDQAGLPTWFLGQFAYSNAPLRTINGRKCRMSTSDASNWPLRELKGARTCIHDLDTPRFENGLPLVGYTPDGKVAFEVTRLDVRSVPLSRFNPPRPGKAPLIIAARTGSTCSG